MRSKTFKNKLYLTALAGVIMPGFYTTAHAQSNSTTVNNDEIFVVATRREEGLQEVPIAVSVLGADIIETLKPQSLQDFSGLAPNVHIGSAGATPGGGAIFIRGLGYQDVEKTQNPPVGVGIDGIFLGTSTGQLLDSFDVEQIEVSRGPQGIFFGKNTTGGVINVRRTKPTRETGGRIALGTGSHNLFSAKGIFNIPVTEKGGLKLGGTYNQNDGYLDNVFLNETVGGQEYLGLTAAFDYDLTDNINVLLSYDYMDLDGEGTSVTYGNPIATSFLESVGVPISQFPTFNSDTSSPIGLGVREVANDFEEASSLRIDLFNATVTIDTGFGEITSVTGYLDQTDFQSQDFDGTCSAAGAACGFAGTNLLLTSAANPTGTLHTERPQAYEQFTQEIRLAGSTMEDRLDYLLGFYYYEHKVDVNQTTNGAILQTAGEENDSLSFFGNLDFAVTDDLTVSAGARYIDESKEFFSGYDLLLPGATIPIVTPFTDEGDFDDVITRFAVDWQASPNHLLYISRAEGFRSGGFSIRGTLSEQIAGQPNCDGGVVNPGNTPGVSIQCPGNNFLRYEPENVTTIELGAKNTFLDGDLTVNAAYFNTTAENLQDVSITVTGFGPGTNTYINNLPEVEIDGFEFDFLFRPDSLEGFSLSGVLGLQDGEVTDGVLPGDRSQIGVGGSPGNTGSSADFTGSLRGLGRIADYNFNIAATYEFDMGPGALTLNASYNYIDDHALSAGFGQRDIEVGYGLLNAYIGYSWDNYSISLTGRNLTDKDYRIGSLASVYFDRWGDDMNWLAEIKAEF